MAHHTRSVGIFVFSQVEVMDFAGPYEVFSLADHTTDRNTFKVFLVAQSAEQIEGRNGFTVVPQYTFDT